MIKITFEYDPVFEFRKTVFMLNKIKSGFFQKQGFIASHMPINAQKALIIVPKYAILRSSTFWNNLSKQKIPKSICRDFKTENLAELWDEIKNEQALKTETDSIEKKWRLIEKDFFDAFDSFLIGAKLIKSIRVYLTRYGTSASYNINDKGELIILLRQDQSIDEIAFCILSGLLALTVSDFDDKNPINSYTWVEKQRIIDYLMTQTKFAKFFLNFNALVDEIRKNHISKAIMDESNRIYDSLGYPATIDLKLKNEIITYNGKELFSLTKSEKSVLSTLLKKEGEVVSFDEIATILWGSDADNYFSLEAILKVIERIRKILKETGINKEVIHTKRKLGYILAK